MIADLDGSLEQLLINELSIKNREVLVKFAQPNRTWSAKIDAPIINLFLYDVRENVTLRQHQWQQSTNGNGRDGLAHMKRTPFRIDCLYALTTWAREPADEHRLLSRCLLALLRHPTLPEDVLTGTMRDQPFEVPARVAAHDKLTNPAELWSALDNELRPSLPYLVTIALDPWQEISGPLVQSMLLRSGQSHEPAAEQLAAEPGLTEVVTLGGQVKKRGEPQAGLQVAIKGSGLRALTDENGRFRLAPVPKGEHTLLVQSGRGRPKTFKIEAPGGDYNIDL